MAGHQDPDVSQMHFQTLSPTLPGCLSGSPHFLQMIFISQGIHRLPKALVEPGAKLAFPSQPIHRFPLPYRRVAIDIVDYARRKHKEAAIDPPAIALGFLEEICNESAVESESPKPAR